MNVPPPRAPAGEQRRRDYNWDAAGIDPAQHRFGAVDRNGVGDGVRKALQPGLDPSLQVGGGGGYIPAQNEPNPGGGAPDGGGGGWEFGGRG